MGFLSLLHVGVSCAVGACVKGSACVLSLVCADRMIVFSFSGLACGGACFGVLGTRGF